MPQVHLSGQLVCRDDDEVARVERYLPDHVVLTRAETGCLSFDVTRRADDPRVWQVEEWFHDEAAFAAHQERVADSTWGERTAGIERRYVTESLDDEEIERRHREQLMHQRLEIIEAIVAALDRRTEVHDLIAAAASADVAREQLQDLLGIDTIGATAVLDLQARRFTRFEADRIRGERDDLRRQLQRVEGRTDDHP